MSPGDRLTINASSVAHETIDGEVVIVNFENGNYYSLLGSGAEIWAMIENGATVRDIIEAVDGRYTGDRSQIEAAIGTFVQDLRAEELVIHSNGHEPGKGPAPDQALELKGNGMRPAFVAPVLTRYTDVQDLLVLDPVHDVDQMGWPTPKLTADE